MIWVWTEEYRWTYIEDPKVSDAWYTGEIDNMEAVVQQDAAGETPFDADGIIERYYKVKRAKAKRAAAAEADDLVFATELKRLESLMHAFLLKHNQQSSSTKEATFYFEETIQPSAADWKVFYDWVKQNDAFDFLEKRITKGEVKKYMEANDDKPPPGVNVFREKVVRVRKK